jgi:hypothetical protein
MGHRFTQLDVDMIHSGDAADSRLFWTAVTTPWENGPMNIPSRDEMIRSGKFDNLAVRTDPED